jgi:DNA repair protein RecO (recombination protein O)
VSYHIYTTKGIILSSRAWKESDRIYNILTRDLGLVRATALGVRKETSKLRGSLEPFQLSLISLVRGKDHWRITSAESKKKIPTNSAFLRPFKLVEQLVQGETPHQELFDTLANSLEEKEDEQLFEIKLVSKILYNLGYLKENDLKLEKKDLIKAINHGLEASHL